MTTSSVQTFNAQDSWRQLAAGAMSLADSAIGDIYLSLHDADMYDQSIIVVASDNGGNPGEGGNNWPLRGCKVCMNSGV